jgi:hypothetical protein
MDAFEVSAARRPAQAQTPEEITRFIVGAAVHAPSVHNTQPWWFSYGDLGITVHADPDRKLGVADPGGREMMISCGAALLTARVALRQLGYVPEVTVLPDPDMPNLVARIRWDREVPPTDFERQLFAEVERRHTHRGGFSAAVLPARLLDALRAEAAKEKARLGIMADGGGQQSALAGIVEVGDYVVRTDQARAQEQANWAPPPGSSRRDGVPPTAYQAVPDRTEPYFAGRDFARGHGWGIPPRADGGQASAGVACLLTTRGDERGDWLQAGQALQRVLLLASSCGVSAALHSQPLEVPELRDFIRTYFAARAYPQLILRLGTTSQEAVSPRRPLPEVLL